MIDWKAIVRTAARHLESADTPVAIALKGTPPGSDVVPVAMLPDELMHRQALPVRLRAVRQWLWTLRRNKIVFRPDAVLMAVVDGDEAVFTLGVMTSPVEAEKIWRRREAA